ncbi:Zinc finger CCCH domain-containing protein 3 [Ceratocystis fimbriata CBS 114723]|uniref:Zinc finger CCCH domain-containing protein 3 n=1 Tax=Ceratocystis fimbriata CBS 114723 TaxID=1035309 RepID=A0A2C5X5C4_9PEZI|nr:Zinc finger CCCH domain-containing protein 3 [Ceratocystis fimbriata CBS 114723]
MDDERSRLLSRISQLAGQINRHKNSQTSGSLRAGAHSQSGYNTPSNGYHPYQRARGTRGGYRGRGHYAGFSGRLPAPNSSNTSTSDVVTSASTSTTTPSFVTRSDRHLQLINTNVYDQDASSHSRALQLSKQKHLQDKSAREKAKLRSFLRSKAISPSNINHSDNRQYTIDVGGIKYHVANGGSKLIKAGSTHPRGPISQSQLSNLSPDKLNMDGPTPKIAMVGGVKFFRSKHGNLYRESITTRTGHEKLRAMQSLFFFRYYSFSKLRFPALRLFEIPNSRYSMWQTTSASGVVCQPKSQHTRSNSKRRRPRSKPSSPVPTLTCVLVFYLGSCPKGPQCRYVHDYSRVAICKEFLQKGTCPSGDHCDLSHDLKPERTPTCLHYSKGNCSNPECRYAHSVASLGAMVCQSFGLYGYCDKGTECPQRHVFECPDFSNTGKCNTKGCKLLHRERASVLRKQQEREANGDYTDISSDEESVGSGDFDSDMEELFHDDDDSDFDLDQDMVAL